MQQKVERSGEGAETNGGQKNGRRRREENRRGVGGVVRGMGGGGGGFGHGETTAFDCSTDREAGQCDLAYVSSEHSLFGGSSFGGQMC